MPTHAIVRDVSSSFHLALARDRPTLEVERARTQHRTYREALESLGLTIIRLPPDDALPDCCFVEDGALHLDGETLLTRPGALSRRGEIAALEDALRPFGPLHRTEAPATLDGGDCMRVGRRIFVGRSARTNEAGIRTVERVFAPRGFEVVGVEVGTALHLKSVCSPLTDDRILLAEGTIPASRFPGTRPCLVPREEEGGANCVVVGTTALIQPGFPSVVSAVEEAGLTPCIVDTSELRKADSALTCLSILI